MIRSLGIFILLLLLGVKILLVWLESPIPQYEGSIKIATIKDDVEVYTDNYGVPHIFAANEEDLFFSAGYIAARDRLFQLSMVRLAVKGELSSVLGKDYVSTDIYFRSWGIYNTATKLVEAMSKENKLIFDSFCKGINYRIEEINRNLPIEFKLMNFEPGYWDPAIVAGYARMMAYEMSGSWKPEIVFGAINSYFGQKKLEELIPSHNVDLPTISHKNSKNIFALYDRLIDEEYKLRGIFGSPLSDIGSNNWVIHGSRTASGHPLLANDPHLAFSQPSRWYEIRLSGGRFNVSGVCIAGIPLPVIGQNERTAWGFTNTMVDDLDFFYEKVNELDSTKYLYESEWYDFISREESIPIKGHKDTTITIRETNNGPVISDIHPLLKNSDQVVSMSWTGHWVTKELDAWVQLTLMKDWNDFSNALKNFGVPGQNIVYADVDGNIGWRPAVYIPIRKEGFTMIPRPGHKKEYTWKGKIPFEDMPFLFNPEKGFIATANNKTIGNEFPYYISGHWADPSRAKRINKVLNDIKQATVSDMKKLQLDYHSNFASTLVPNILKHLDSNSVYGHKEVYFALKNWDYVESPESVGALVFHVFLMSFIKNIYSDEINLLGDNYFELFSSLKYLLNRNIREILNGNNNSWVDDIKTKDKIETVNDLVRNSLLDTHKYLTKNFGPNKSNWKWGDAHTVTHQHIIGKNKILDYLFKFNVGPFRSGGSEGTPNAGGYSTALKFKQTSGASMRRIVDFNNMNMTSIILPTGQSGLRKSPHYKDQSRKYSKGQYRITYFDKNFIKNNKNFKKLILTND